ncbi:EcsC family protein [Flammeovirga sp. MY04]|uniref:EcsC family protein n=1 Tax=Flammeovirga sp. MY04 TaxID=1191459 RepID=UPI0008062379|nr:EcsC family protein [Flammeovirga sp. MY04]ANQ49877.1 EcsC family protein [Flammeovirga sp. MY04]
MTEKKKVSSGMIMKVMDYGYEKAVNGFSGFDSAEEMARDYMDNGKDLVTNANSLIRWQISKAGTSGFLTSLGGLITLPVAIPANVASVIYVQIRMIAAIAHMGGFDLRDDKVKTLVYLCMAGNGAKDILKDIGIVIGKKVTTNMINSISEKTIVAINQKVGFKLVTKFGEKGAINLGKAIPLVGGIIGGTFDSVSTNAIGNVARKTFIESGEE